jgi:hypothetical protein
MKIDLSSITLSLLFIMAGILIIQSSCTHSTIMDPDDMMNDTTDMDTSDMDTTAMDTCNPDFVYFQQEILPIFQSNCATSGCHDAETAEEGVVLTDYENIITTGEVEPFDLSGSEIWERITDSDPDKRMPPPPASSLDPSTLSVIEKWILQGATDSSCMQTECITTDMSFEQDITPIFSSYCYSCHTGSSPNADLDLSVYSEVKAIANNGQLYCAVAHLQGCVPMPFGGNKMPQCSIDQIKSWIDAGAPNN